MSEFTQSVPQFAARLQRVGFVLEADDEFVDIPDHSGKAGASFADYLLKPEIKGVVEVDIGQHW